MKSIADLRQDYRQAQLLESDVLPDPIDQFHRWFEQALAAQVPEPNAMTLATATPDGIPSARIVLLKGIDQGGFVFYTNYQSAKAQQMAANPQAALVFFWVAIERQVCIRGSVSKVSREDADQYYHSRPKGSQLGAWASRQSTTIPSREVLENEIERLEKEYEDKTVPLPEFWGGYRVVPQSVEFWQGRTSRLHDRILYTKQSDNSWKISRLSP